MTIESVLDTAIADESIPGAVAAVTAPGRDPVIYVAGNDGDGSPLRRDTIMRIASISKPIVAAAALSMVDSGDVAPGDPIVRWLPELAGRPVLRADDAQLDDTVPAEREVTVDDVLTFRCGDGMLPRFPMDAPIQLAYAEAQLGSDGPPGRYAPPAPDEWIRRLAALPMVAQPGTRWLYQTPSDLLGVLLSRIAGRTLPELLAERIFEPAGMVDTAFFVPPEKLDRFVPLWTRTEGVLQIFDPADGMWSSPPEFPLGSSGLVSTIDDLVRFTDALRDGRLVSAESLAAMTTDHLTPQQREDADVFLDGAGWGYGQCVESNGYYGWDGGLGTGWRTDPQTGVADVLLTQVMWTSPQDSALVQRFREAAHAR